MYVQREFTNLREKIFYKIRRRKRRTEFVMEQSRVTVKIIHLSKRIRKRQILDDINIEMHGGRIYGFKGKNVQRYILKV